MTGIRLSKLPARISIKLTVAILPELHQKLSDYGVFYGQQYGAEEPLIELIPAMLDAFLDSDRAFAKARPTLSPKRGDHD